MMIKDPTGQKTTPRGSAAGRDPRAAASSHFRDFFANSSRNFTISINVHLFAASLCIVLTSLDPSISLL